MNANGFYQIDNAFLDTWGPQIGPVGIAVVNVLARYADVDGICWPAHSTIAEHIGASRSTVIRKIKQLEDLGILRCEARKEANGIPASNRYTLLLGCVTVEHPSITVEHRVCQGDTGVVSQWNRNKTHRTRPREEDVQRCTAARPAPPSAPKPVPPTDPLIAAFAIACPRAVVTSAKSGAAIAWLKANGKSPEWLLGFAEWYASEHEGYENPYPNPSQIMGSAVDYDAHCAAEAAAAARRAERRAKREAYERREEAQRAADQERAEREREERERQKAAGTYVPTVYAPHYDLARRHLRVKPDDCWTPEEASVRRRYCLDRMKPEDRANDALMLALDRTIAAHTRSDVGAAA